MITGPLHWCCLSSLRLRRSTRSRDCCEIADSIASITGSEPISIGVCRAVNVAMRCRRRCVRLQRGAPCGRFGSGEAGQSLAIEVRAARAVGLPIVMLHENDRERHGCEFGHFFTTTPPDLIQDGLYKALALACYPGSHRAVSMALAARALGAVSSGQPSWKPRSAGHASRDPMQTRRRSSRLRSLLIVARAGSEGSSPRPAPPAAQPSSS